MTFLPKWENRYGKYAFHMLENCILVHLEFKFSLKHLLWLHAFGTWPCQEMVHIFSFSPNPGSIHDYHLGLFIEYCNWQLNYFKLILFLFVSTIPSSLFPCCTACLSRFSPERKQIRVWNRRKVKKCYMKRQGHPTHDPLDPEFSIFLTILQPKQISTFSS